MTRPVPAKFESIGDIVWTWESSWRRSRCNPTPSIRAGCALRSRIAARFPVAFSAGVSRAQSTFGQSNASRFSRKFVIAASVQTMIAANSLGRRLDSSASFLQVVRAKRRPARKQSRAAGSHESWDRGSIAVRIIQKAEYNRVPYAGRPGFSFCCSGNALRRCIHSGHAKAFSAEGDTGSAWKTRPKRESRARRRHVSLRVTKAILN